MEKRFVEIFTGLKRDYGYADPQSAYKDPSTGKLKIEHFWAGSLKTAVLSGDIENGSLMAGQSVSMVKKIQSVKEILDELILQAVKQITVDKKVLESVN